MEVYWRVIGGQGRRTHTMEYGQLVLAQRKSRWLKTEWRGGGRWAEDMRAV